MHEPFFQHIKKFVNIPDEDLPGILSHFQVLKVKKKQNLLENGMVCRTNYFVVKGCLRMFFINDKGTEQTTHFAIENWWISDYLAFQNQKESEFFIQAVENAEVLAIDFQAQEKLLMEYPVMERYFRCVYQKAFAASQLRVKYMYDFSKEDLYLHFEKWFPEFVQRIPQYLVASYLGFTPEYLSEIRKKRIS
jgi:CRP-like cAMP-binding protein